MRYIVVVIGNTRHDVLQLQSIAAIERQVDHSLLIDDLADRRVYQVRSLTGLASHLNSFRVRSDRQLRIYGHVLVNLENYSTLQVGFEAFCYDLDGVISDREDRNAVISIAI